MFQNSIIQTVKKLYENSISLYTFFNNSNTIFCDLKSAHIKHIPITIQKSNANNTFKTLNCM